MSHPDIDPEWHAKNAPNYIHSSLPVLMHKTKWGSPDASYAYRRVCGDRITIKQNASGAPQHLRWIESRTPRMTLLYMERPQP